MVKKGISPIVAVVLMVSVAITIGIFVTTWITHWVVTQTSSPSLTCAINTNYVIDSVTFTTSTSKLLIKITNKGSEPLYGFGLVVDNSTVILQFNSSGVNQGGISQTNKLRREQATYIFIDNSTSYNSIDGRRLNSTIGSTLTEVRVTNDACNAIAAKTTSIAQN